MVISGDLFDGDWKDMGTGLYFARAMGRLAQADVPFFLLSVNHDAASVLTRSIPWPDNVKLFGTRRPETHVLAEFAVAVHGQSFATPAVTDNLVLASRRGRAPLQHRRAPHRASPPPGAMPRTPRAAWRISGPSTTTTGRSATSTSTRSSQKTHTLSSRATRRAARSERPGLRRGDSDGGGRPDRHHRAYRTGRTALGACRGRLHRGGGGRGGLAHTRIAPLSNWQADAAGLPLVARVSLTGETADTGVLHDEVSSIRDNARGRRVDIAGPVHRKGEGAMPCKQRPIIPQMICHTPITELFISVDLRLFGPILSHKPVTTSNCLNNL